MKKKIFIAIFTICLGVFASFSLIKFHDFNNQQSGQKSSQIIEGDSGKDSELEKYSIVFLVDDQEFYKFETSGNETIKCPDNPKKTGYTFNGWYLDENMETEFDKDSYLNEKLSSNIYIYSRFEVNKYTISFDSNGGSTIDSITQDYNGDVLKPEDPTKKGYQFLGWFTDDENFENEYTFSKMPLNGMTLYAKWREILFDKSIITKQTSINFVNDKLNQIEVVCKSHQGCNISWENHDDEKIDNAYGNYTATHTSSSGDKSFCEVTVSAIASLDSSYCFQDMIFTLDSTKKTATVKANSEDIKKAIIPENVCFKGEVYTVDALEYHAFYDLDSLIYAYIPKTILKANSAAFAYCDNLNTVEFDEKFIGKSVQMFMNCTKLENINIPSSMTEIPYGFLYNCVSITNIEIPSSVTKIDGAAFYCTSLSSIDLHEGLLTIEKNSFSNNYFEELIIPSTVKTIGDKAFSGITSLKKLTLLSDDVSLGLGAFNTCNNLSSVYLNSNKLVNSIDSDTSETSCLLKYLKNNNIIYINETINVTSPYISDLFTEVTSSSQGYKAYKFGKYSSLNVLNMTNRVYQKDATFYGDETIKIKNSENNWITTSLSDAKVEFFDTSTIGKKCAKITYKYNVVYVDYYVLTTADSTELNCINQINNFYPTYYVGESLVLSKLSLRYYHNDNGYMIYEDIEISQNMVEGFSSAASGVGKVIFKKDGHSYSISYYVKEELVEKVTDDSFENGKYYSEDTTEETEHFIINIKKGSYLAHNYKEIIEKIYNTQQSVSGLEFSSTKIVIDVDINNYPSCAGLTLNLQPSDLLFSIDSAFVHELAHALDYSQSNNDFYNAVLSEGFATYIEYLTAKELYLNDPETYSYINTMSNVIFGNDFLGSKMYFYDFENRLLYLGKDELVANSQYEVGAKFFAYLDYRYGDFCSWMKSDLVVANDIEEWKTFIKQYYENDNLFSEMYGIYQNSGDKFNDYLGADNNSSIQKKNDLTALNKYNYYFKFYDNEDIRGNISIVYKELYVNIDSARVQLTSKGVSYQNLYLKSDKNITIELYDKDGNLIRIEENSQTEFSLEGVSFIKLCGTNNATFDLTYV